MSEGVEGRTSSREWMAFNVNEYARIRLSSACLEEYRARAKEMQAAYPMHAHLFSDEPKLDAEGFYVAQLWEIMGRVASQCHGGGSVSVDGEIQLDASAFRRASPPGRGEMGDG